jgi:hypothetical protein
MIVEQAKTQLRVVVPTEEEGKAAAYLNAHFTV